MNNKPHIILIIGASASGKDTIKKYLLEKDADFKNMIPITTRPMRSYEQDGVDYQFISKEKFENMISKNELMEHRKYDIIDSDGNIDVWYYGHVNPIGDYNVMVAPLDVYNNIKDNPNFIIYPFYIHLRPVKRLERMIERENKMDNPNYKELARRFFSDEKDFSEEKIIDAGLINGNNSIFIENINSQVTAAHIFKVIEGLKNPNTIVDKPWFYKTKEDINILNKLNNQE